MEGHKPGTPVFEAKVRQKQVSLCQELQLVPNCLSCPAYDDCEIVKAHLRDIRFGVPGVEVKDATGTRVGHT
jgi:hypothetical protein